VIGVVLSGYLDCGTAGLMSVKARGGIAVVQDPATATAPDMPQSALRRVAVDHVVAPAELPGLLTRLASEAAPPSEPHGEAVDVLEGTKPGGAAELVCPLCHGVLTEVTLGEFRHYRCHVGHAFSLDSLLGEQGEDVERALWAAVRSLEEAAALSRRMHRSEHDPELRRRFGEKGEHLMRQADVIRRILLHGERLEADPGRPADEPS
jgi:two-component system chemotaxis response regulator CheB